MKSWTKFTDPPISVSQWKLHICKIFNFFPHSDILSPQTNKYNCLNLPLWVTNTFFLSQSPSSMCSQFCTKYWKGKPDLWAWVLYFLWVLMVVGKPPYASSVPLIITTNYKCVFLQVKSPLSQVLRCFAENMPSYRLEGLRKNYWTDFLEILGGVGNNSRLQPIRFWCIDRWGANPFNIVR